MPWAWSPFCFLSSQTWDGCLPESSSQLNCLPVNTNTPLTHTPQVDREFSKNGEENTSGFKAQLNHENTVVSKSPCSDSF